MSREKQKQRKKMKKRKALGLPTKREVLRSMFERLVVPHSPMIVTCCDFGPIEADVLDAEFIQ